MHFLLIPGPGLLTWFPGSITGLNLGIVISLKLILIVGVFNLFTLTTSQLEIFSLFHWLLGPLMMVGIPVEKAVFGIVVCFKLIPMTQFEIRNYIAGQKAQGAFLQKRSVLQRLNGAFGFVGKMYTNVQDRALLMVMDSVGIQGLHSRKTYDKNPLKFNRIDFPIIASSLILMALIFQSSFRIFN